MAFLDNSGDILLDAVLTDEGRRRLAMGDGSFRITKFALGDDEIDYSLYVPATASGYEDTRILQLPVFEAFTNNTTSLKSRVLSYADNSLLYLPVSKLNSKIGPTATDSTGPIGGYYVSVDSTTTTLIGNLDKSAASSNGYRFAQAGAFSDQSRLVIDQGLDTANLALGYLAGASSNQQEQSLYESAFLVEVDNRLLGLTTPSDLTVAQPSFIDDDNIATYYFALGTDSSYFARQKDGKGGSAEPAFEIVTDSEGTRSQNSMIGPTNITGRLGSRLVFGLRSSLNLQNSQDLFNRLGGTASITVGSTPTSFSFINTVVRITGFNTGYRVEVPLKLLKYTS
ncbi:MAG: hypothetical protein ACXADL_17680 [Candidatus Thorarchaeota archaeon]|jgi:hypothetical protein